MGTGAVGVAPKALKISLAGPEERNPWHRIPPGKELSPGRRTESDLGIARLHGDDRILDCAIQSLMSNNPAMQK